MTLVELMVTLAIFTLMMAAFITVHMYGLRQDELVNSELGANDAARINFQMLLDEIRSCKDAQIGTGTYSNFKAITNGPQQGPALQLTTSTNTSINIYYWFDTNAWALWRASVASNGTLLQSNIVARYLTNQVFQSQTNAMTFKAMDYTGTTNLTINPTNYNFNYTIMVFLQFAQFQYPLTPVGSNYLVNYYQLTYSATRRTP